MLSTRRIRHSRQARLWLLLLPYLLGTALLVVLPALLSFGLAFFRYNALSAPVWVGARNFLLAYTDELFALSVRNTLALVLLAVPLRLLGIAAVALLLRRGGRGLALARGAVFLPSIMPGTAYALAWLWILNPSYGPLNLLLGALGLATPAWFADPLWAKPALILVLVWQIGEGMLVSLAALHDVPPQLEDAALVDGANPWQRLWLIVFPLLAPVLLILAIRDVVLVIQESFVATVVLTGGGPYYATYTLPLFVFEQGFDLLAFGTASAALWVLYGLTSLLVLVLLFLAGGWGVGLRDDYGLL